MRILSSKFKHLSGFAKPRYILPLFISLLISACATHRPQYGKNVAPTANQPQLSQNEQPIHQFFLIGDAGNAEEENATKTLELLRQRLNQAGTAATLIFLGDNIYPNGMPTKLNTEERNLAELKLSQQINIQKDFKGNTVFIPGNHDWYNGLSGLNEQEKFITQHLGKKSFLPRNGCAIESKKIDDKIGLIIIDSQWFLEDWDKNPNINALCEITTREDFFDEFERLLNNNQNKITLVAVHHPIIDNGSHGGQFSLKKQLFPLEQPIPLPVLGSAINLLRKTSAISPQDNQHPVYRDFNKRIETLVADRQNVVFISGHDHNLQYAERKNIKQIISGSGSKTEAARAIRKNDFSYGNHGYAVLDVFEDQSSVLRFYGNENGVEKLLFSHQLTEPMISIKDLNYPEEFPATKKAKIYSDELAHKGPVYNFLFGKHFRKYYNMEIEAPTLNLKDFDPSIFPVKSGGGHQSRSLRLQTSDGKQYVMRALKKSATRFLQALAFKDQYIEKDFENTVTEEFLLDFYTTAHPYFPFVIGELSAPLGIYHTQPKLYYIPKQNILGQYNASYGDELYMVEERPMKKFSDAENFGKPDDIISTENLLFNLQTDEKYKIDEKSFIRARLFDMLIGDWDRHQDQWRWAEFDEDGQKIYRPIPRDRDQVFPKYDGALISFVMRIPALRHMQDFKEDIRNVKWFNMEAYPLDLALIQHASLSDWIEQSNFITESLTDEIIDQSFRNLPEEAKDEEVVRIKELLKIRKKHLFEYAIEYFKVLHRTVVLHATNKADKIVVTRLPKGETQIQIFRKKATGDELFFDKSYSRKFTQDIWIYGLNDDDEFIVQGHPQNPILVRLIGGNGNDAYQVENGRKIRIYDYDRHKNTLDQAGSAKVYLSNDYELNQYNYQKPKYNRMSMLPSGGYNPDDGVKLGLSTTWTINKFDRSPFTRKHNLLTNYYFATTGLEFTYTGTFAKFINKWNLEVEARFTSPTFTTNFFGYGNETDNHQKKLGMDYNRIKMQTLSVSPSLYLLGKNNDRLTFKLKVEDVQVMRTHGRITEFSHEINPNAFQHQIFGDAGIKYSFLNYDNLSLPTMGLSLEAEAHWITNLGDTKKSFPYFVGTLGIIHKITSDESLTFATRIKGKTIWNNNFEFFQAASIGGDFDMRAYRAGRFIGRESFYHSSDLRLLIGRTKRNFVPLKYGLLVGFDQGRVWLDGESSKKWHQSIGGGLWINGVNTITGNVNYFTGSDGGRISFGINFGF